MRVKIKRIDKTLPLPEYKTGESAGFDIYPREDATIPPGKAEIVAANLVVEAPKGYFLAVFPRSGTFLKKGLMLANSVGVVDRDYSGPEDEIGIILYNPGKEPVTVQKGERIAQGLFIPVSQAEWDEVDEIRKDSRGGFGSTG
jgi:dUTP pyrophosphatase